MAALAVLRDWRTNMQPYMRHGKRRKAHYSTSPAFYIYINTSSRTAVFHALCAHYSARPQRGAPIKIMFHCPTLNFMIVEVHDSISARESHLHVNSYGIAYTVNWLSALPCDIMNVVNVISSYAHLFVIKTLATRNRRHRFLIKSA